MISDLPDRFLEFAARVIRLLEAMPQNQATKKISDQLLRSVMSVGANYEEAKGADSRADFGHKLQIALKEMRETRYWLCLIEKLGWVPRETMDPVIREATELRAILGKSVATVRGKAKDTAEKQKARNGISPAELSTYQS